MSGWWGGGWGNHTPQSAVEVAEAFFAGKTRKRSSCRTDGESYRFISKNVEVEIARRLKNGDAVAAAVAASLEGHEVWKPLEFRTCGWLTPTTARHFNALGLKAQCHGIKSPKFWVNGRLMPDDWAGWFTLDDVQNWPSEDPEVVAERAAREAREQARQYRQGRKFIQITGRLFE